MRELYELFTQTDRAQHLPNCVKPLLIVCKNYPEVKLVCNKKLCKNKSHTLKYI